MSDAMKEQKPTPRPWRMLLPLLVVLVLAAAWSVYWLVAASAARNTFDERMAFATERGQRLDCASEDWGGYPFRFEFTCDKPVVTDKALGVLSSGRLRAVAMAYNPWHVLLLVDGPTIFTPAGRPPLTLDHHTILTSLQFADGASDPEVSVEISMPTWSAGSRPGSSCSSPARSPMAPPGLPSPPARPTTSPRAGRRCPWRPARWSAASGPMACSRSTASNCKRAA